jgi:ubiquinone/menaquinone biosynthesis C-methylase UbiE
VSSDPRTVDYLAGYSQCVLELMRSRTADTHAAFLLPFLRSGLRILDCGCGPGSITLGLAARVAPGEVIGLDLQTCQCLPTLEEARRQGLTNLHFAVGDMQKLNFPPESFDVIFCHGALSYVPERQQCIESFWRLLKPEGMLAVRDGDYEGNVVVGPGCPLVEKVILEFFPALGRERGADAYIGRRLPEMLKMGGFGRVQFSASYEFVKAALAGNAFAALFSDPAHRQQVVDLGLASESDTEEIPVACRLWAGREFSLWAHAWFEVIGWK